MLQPSEYTFSGKSNAPASPNPAASQNLNPAKMVGAPVEQATIGRTLIIKGELSASESLYIDGRIEGKITMPDHRVTIGRNGVVQANIVAKEVVVMGKVSGNVECSDRVDIRSEGALTGDISTLRISVEDGAILKGGIEVRNSERKPQPAGQAQSKSADTSKPMAAAANA
jgi:cytoskeletal protein CcmA (bactofilin family)